MLATLARLDAQLKRPKVSFLEGEYLPTLPIRGWVYLWTFTLPEDQTFTRLSESWSDLLNQRARDFPSLRGFRVFESSPTGLWHCHMLTLERIDVEPLRSYAQRFGFGRVNVKRIPGSKCSYVCKYLWKSRLRCGVKGAKISAAVGVRACAEKDIDTRSTWDDYVSTVCPSAVGISEPWHLRQSRALKIWLDSTKSK